MTTVAYSYKVKGLQVSLRSESVEVPVGSTYHWDFGDNTPIETSNLAIASHVYETNGKYNVKLEIKNTSGETLGNSTKEIELIALTGLMYSISEMVDSYIPTLLLDTWWTKKEYFIDKWQLYIQPLVNHEIPLQKYNDEKYYEALENQLIMELAAYDFMVIELNKAIANISVGPSLSLQVDDGGAVTGSSDDNVKKITTGPTEVEYFDKYEAASKILKVLSGSRGGDYGVLANLKANIQMLSERLQIYLPAFGRDNVQPVAPRVARR